MGPSSSQEHSHHFIVKSVAVITSRRKINFQFGGHAPVCCVELSHRVWCQNTIRLGCNHGYWCRFCLTVESQEDKVFKPLCLKCLWAYIQYRTSIRFISSCLGHLPFIHPSIIFHLFRSRVAGAVA